MFDGIQDYVKKVVTKIKCFSSVCHYSCIDIDKLSSIKNSGQDNLSQATLSQAHYALDIPDAP